MGKETPLLAKTGVKFGHAKAKHRDVGIYFEANGHGTLLFSDKLVSKLQSLEKVNKDAALLLAWRDLVNETVGDALADLLATEAILSYWDWPASTWGAEYVDLPNRLRKVAVPDRFLVETDCDNEAFCTKPEGLQAAVDAAVAEAGVSARSFVRPSGTEDVIRVYAEAASETAAEALCTEVCELVKKYC